MNRLTDRISNKVDTSKDDTLSLAKKINKIQHEIKDVTKKMMAKVSELSIAQASALKLQEEVKTKELFMEQAISRMEKGEAPSDDIENEWIKIIEDDERLRNRQDKSLVLKPLMINTFFFFFGNLQKLYMKKKLLKILAGRQNSLHNARWLRDDG